MSEKRFLVDGLINFILLIIFINFFVIVLGLDWMSTNSNIEVYITIFVISFVCTSLLFLVMYYLNEDNFKYMLPRLYEDTQKIVYCLSIKNVGFINANDITVSITRDDNVDKVEFEPQPKKKDGTKEWVFDAINKGSFKEITITLDKGTNLKMEDLRDKTKLEGNQAENLLMVDIYSLSKDQEQNDSILKTVHFILFNNTFLFLYRSIFLVFVFFALALIISPVQIIVTPQTITENISSGDFLAKTICIENIGTGLTYLNITQRTENIGSVNKLIDEINITLQNINQSLLMLNWTNEKDTNVSKYEAYINTYNNNLIQMSNKIMSGEVTVKKGTDFIDKDIENISLNIQKLKDGLTNESNKLVMSKLDNIFGETSRMLHKYKLFISLSDISYSDIPKGQKVFATIRIDCSRNEIQGEYIGEILLAPRASGRLESKTSIPLSISVRSSENANSDMSQNDTEKMLKV